ncbi:MAG: hypothetical protein AMJ76_01395 [Dehalococcoidia bacterium SM23_28_1]|nr:MAG: hypothetical protein AMJ76_01395 [Dehalococcoidia bacterium SM23_28_1]
MNEEEQAKRLCDAIDALIRGEQPDMELDDQELIDLLRVARIRHQAGKALANVGLTYQELLRRVLKARIVARQMEQGHEKADDAAPEVSSIMDEDPSDFLDPLEPGYGKLLNFLDFQPRTPHPAPAVPTTTAQARPAVARQHRPRMRTLIPHWLRWRSRNPDKAQALSAALDRLVSSRKRTISADDPEIDELLQVARLRRFVGQSLANAGSPYKRRLWTVLRMRLAASLRRQAYAAQRPAVVAAVGRLSWQQATAVAAGIALLLAALGPLPATGFADHPIAHLLSLVEQGVGVEEVDGPPPTEVPVTAPEELIAPEEAAQRLGLAVSQPSYLPEGFELARSSYHPRSITSPEQGMLVLAYTIGGIDPTTVSVGEPILVIYQERASSDTMAVMNGQSEDLLLAGDVSATYAHALWIAGEQGTLEGTDPNAESLFFINGDVRVIITYRDGDQEKEELVRIAESMLTQ